MRSEPDVDVLAAEVPFPPGRAEGQRAGGPVHAVPRALRAGLGIKGSDWRRNSASLLARAAARRWISRVTDAGAGGDCAHA